MVKKLATAAISALLITIVGFGEAGGYVPSNSADLEALKAAGHIEVGQPSADGTQVAVRATPAGVAASVAVPPPQTSAPAAVKPTFALATVPIPEAKKGGNKGKSIYPFEEMQVGMGFFIPASTETPAPWKSLTSTATSATRRYDETVTENGAPVMETVTVKGKSITREKKLHTRVFVMRGPLDGAPWGQPGVQGAGVFRTQ